MVNSLGRITRDVSALKASLHITAMENKQISRRGFFGVFAGMVAAVVAAPALALSGRTDRVVGVGELKTMTAAKLAPVDDEGGFLVPEHIEEAMRRSVPKAWLDKGFMEKRIGYIDPRVRFL